MVEPIARAAFYLLIALALYPLDLFSVRKGNPNHVNWSVVRENLGQLEILSPEDQAKLIHEMVPPPELKAPALLELYNFSGKEGLEFLKKLIQNQETAPELHSEELLILYHHAKKEEGSAFLNKLIKARYPTKEEQQKFINNLQEKPTYSDFLQNPTEDLCAHVAANVDPTYFGATPIVDWLNTAHFSGFFNPTMTNALANQPYHNDFDSFNQWGLWIEPFGFSTQFRNEPAPLKFNQHTVGIAAGGEYTFFDRLVLGLGIAYSHSGIDWKEGEGHGNLNSLYFGPALNYVFSHGYLGCTLFGVANFYQIDRKTDLFPGIASSQESTVDYKSWDLVLRLEGGLSFSPGRQFFVYPTARIDYLTVFENGTTESLEENTELEIEGFHESFFSSKLGIKLAREFYTDSLDFVIPSLSFGWLGFFPASIQNYQFQVQECKDLSGRVEPKSWNQYFIGAGLSFLLKRGMLISLDYELTAGVHSPMQAGSLRFELSW